MAGNPASRTRRASALARTRQPRQRAALTRRSRVRRLLAEARPGIERQEYIRQAESFLEGPVTKVRARKLRVGKAAKKRLAGFNRVGILEARRILREKESQIFSKDEGSDFLRRFVRRAKERRLTSTDVRALRTGYTRSGAELQKVFRLLIDIVARRVRPFDMNPEDLGSSTRSLTSRSNTANANWREMLLDLIRRRGKNPAFIQFMLTGLTPGNLRAGVPRKMTTLVSPKYFRFEFSPQVPTEKIPRIKEDLSQFLMRSFDSGMRAINRQMAESYENNDYDDPWTVLKVSIEIGFDTPPTDNQLYRFLAHQESIAQIQRIVGGKRDLKRLRRQRRKK